MAAKSIPESGFMIDFGVRSIKRKPVSLMRWQNRHSLGWNETVCIQPAGQIPELGIEE